MNIGCVSSWDYILVNYSSCIYNAVRVGVSQAERKLANDTYDIDKRIAHPGYFTEPFPQVNEGYDLRYLYASKHALFLDRTARKMRMVAGKWIS